MSLELNKGTVLKSGRAILKDATISAAPGAFVAICGPNGAGKSTALSLLDGSQSPDLGLVTLNGKSLRSIPNKELARVRAVVPQRHQLSFPFQVQEVVSMGRSPHQGRSSLSQDAAICEEAMRLLDVHPMTDRNYLTLSGGERQRVMIARALAQIWEPEEGRDRYLLLDEPTAALDLKYQIALMRLLSELADDGWAILAVLHDLALVKKWCSDVYLLTDGAVVHQGDPQALLTPERVAEVFDLDEPYELS